MKTLKKCEICKTKRISFKPAKVNINGHEFKICDECERVLATIHSKFEERDDLDEQSLPVFRDYQYYEDELDEEF